MQLKSEQGEPLYYILVVNTNEFPTSIEVKTWEKAKEYVQKICRERDDEDWYNHNIKLDINDRMHRIIAENVKNHKGWGYDYFQYITVDMLCFYNN